MAFTALVTAGCGGGGGDEVSTATPAPAAQAPTAPLMYDQNTILPGRLMLSFLGRMDVWTLADGSGRRISEKGDREWQAGRSRDTVIWHDRYGLSSSMRMSFVDTTTWQSKAPDLTVRGDVKAPKLSPDGKYILTYWHDSNLSGIFSPLTIIRASDGAIMRQHSVPNEFTTSTISNHADWLPDGNFVFMEGPFLSRGSLTSTNDQLIAKLPLAENHILGGYSGLRTEVSASPDGTKVAFTWLGDIWVVNIDGTDLHQLTSVPPGAPFSGGFGQPSWSPDSQWIVGLMGRSDSSTAPVFPNPEDTVNPAYQVVGATGCNSPVFVVRADKRLAQISWPQFDPVHHVRVRGADGKLRSLTGCDGSSVQWIP